jgi:hypothetical protein
MLGRLSARGLVLLAQPNCEAGPGAGGGAAATRATRCAGSDGYGMSRGRRVHRARSWRLKRTMAAGQ